MAVNIQKELFGATAQGESVYKYCIENQAGNSVNVMNYGCTLLSVKIRDNSGKRRNLVLGYDSLAEYEAGEDFFGACVGRFGGWIKYGQIELNGNIYQLPLTDGKSHLHGGPKGFNRKVWDSWIDGEKVCFKMVSADGENGYPGEFSSTITYQFTDQNELIINYQGICDKDTICNMTNHSYFNLNGWDGGSVLDHTLQVFADFYDVNDEDGISALELVPVDESVFDFRKSKPIGRDMDPNNTQIQYGHGYDHNFFLGKEGTMKKAAVLYSQKSGIEMQVFTDQSGIQVYTGNYLDGTGKRGNVHYGVNTGICLETQYCISETRNRYTELYPVLKVGEPYKHEVIYKFDVRKDAIND